MIKQLTPSEIVKELDKYIIGQEEAKKSVAIALRNRYRRNLLDDEFKEEVRPKNILMIGPTGVGKTEIARRLANFVEAPFVKVEATKFTEVGYVGRDVDSMIRDLVEASIRMVKSEKVAQVYDKGKSMAEDKIVDMLLPMQKKKNNSLNLFFNSMNDDNEDEDIDSEIIENIKKRRKELRSKIKKGELDDKVIEIEVEETINPTAQMFSGIGMEELNIDMSDIFNDFLPKKTKKRKVTIKEAKKIIGEQEAQKLIDMDEVVDEGIKRAEEDGIVFIDEIDKIAGKDYSSGPDISREGVQRDILPIIEGSTVMTKHGPVKTDHMLFIAAGAFHVSKVNDLIPEIQGRFPIRVELKNLTQENFQEILTKPKNALIKQYQLLLATEGINLTFTNDAISEIAKIAYISNEQFENIGARRLQTVMEKLLEDISFNAPDLKEKNIIIDSEYVVKKLMNEIQQRDISKYIL